MKVNDINLERLQKALENCKYGQTNDGGKAAVRYLQDCTPAILRAVQDSPAFYQELQNMAAGEPVSWAGKYYVAECMDE